MNVSKTIVSGIGLIFGIAMTVGHGKDFITGIKDIAIGKDVSKKEKKNKK